MENTEVTDFLVHNVLPDFPVMAEALWEISPGHGRGQGLVGEGKRESAVEEVGGGGRRKKRKASFRSDESRSSAVILGVHDKWWPFVMRGFEYENASSTDARRRAVVSVQYAECWDKGYANNADYNDASKYTGAKADVVFSLKTTGRGRGLWMKDVNTDDTAVRMRLATSLATDEDVAAIGVHHGPDLAPGPSDSVVQIPDGPALSSLPAMSLEMRVASLQEELKCLRGMVNLGRGASLVARSIGSDWKSRLRVVGVSRILQCLSSPRPPVALQKHYKLALSPSELDGSDTCGNAEIEIFLTDAVFTEFQDLATEAVSTSFPCADRRAYPTPSWQEVSCYNPLAPRPLSIVFPFASDFCDAVGMSPTQRIVDVFRPPRRETAVTCVLGSTEMFRCSEEEVEPCRRDVLLGVCRTSLQVLEKSNPGQPDYIVPMLRLVNSSLDCETKESKNNFSLRDGNSKDIVEDSHRSGVPGTGKSNGFRLKWTPLGWNARKGTATSGAHGKITATLCIVFMKDKKLARGALSFWAPSHEETDSENGERKSVTQGVIDKILCAPGKT